MIKKKDLLNQVNQAIELEKRLLPLLNKHISSTLSFSELKENQRQLIREQLKNSVITQTKHLEILNGIKEEAEKKAQDVF